MMEEYSALASFCVYMFLVMLEVGLLSGKLEPDSTLAAVVKIVVDNLLGLGCTCIERRGLLALHGALPIVAWPAA